MAIVEAMINSVASRLMASVEAKINSIASLLNLADIERYWPPPHAPQTRHTKKEPKETRKTARQPAAQLATSSIYQKSNSWPSYKLAETYRLGPFLLPGQTIW